MVVFGETFEAWLGKRISPDFGDPSVLPYVPSIKVDFV